MLIEELHNLLVGPGGDIRVAFVEAVTAVGNGDEPVCDAFAGEFICHLDGELIGHVGVFGAVDQQCGRIFPRHVAHRTKRVERARFRVRVVTGQHFRPESLLPTVKVEFHPA